MHVGWVFSCVAPRILLLAVVVPHNAGSPWSRASSDSPPASRSPPLAEGGPTSRRPSSESPAVSTKFRCVVGPGGGWDGTLCRLREMLVSVVGATCGVSMIFTNAFKVLYILYGFVGSFESVFFLFVFFDRRLDQVPAEVSSRQQQQAKSCFCFSAKTTTPLFFFFLVMHV